MRRAGPVLARAACCGLALLAGGCTIPRAGPTGGAIEDGAGPSGSAAGAPYVLIDLTTAIGQAVSDGAPPAEASGGLPPGAPVGLLGPEDTLRITLWEPNPTGATLLDPMFVVGLLDLVISGRWLARGRRKAAAAVVAGTPYFPGTPFESPPAPPVTPTAAYEPSGEGIRLERLKTLAALRDSGAVTEDEFQTEKRRILNDP